MQHYALRPQHEDSVTTLEPLRHVPLAEVACPSGSELAEGDGKDLDLLTTVAAKVVTRKEKGEER